MRLHISISEFSDSAKVALRAMAVALKMPDLDTVTSAAQWAWFWFQLRELPDDPYRFPRGKWATLQSIEAKLIEAAQFTTGAVGITQEVKKG